MVKIERGEEFSRYEITWNHLARRNWAKAWRQCSVLRRSFIDDGSVVAATAAPNHSRRTNKQTVRQSRYQWSARTNKQIRPWQHFATYTRPSRLQTMTAFQFRYGLEMKTRSCMCRLTQIRRNKTPSRFRWWTEQRATIQTKQCLSVEKPGKWKVLEHGLQERILRNSISIRSRPQLSSV